MGTCILHKSLRMHYVRWLAFLHFRVSCARMHYAYWRNVVFVFFGPLTPGRRFFGICSCAAQGVWGVCRTDVGRDGMDGAGKFMGKL